MLRKYKIIVVIIFYLLNGGFIFSKSGEVRVLNESDSVYYQDIRSIEFSPNLNLYVVNQISETNRINIYHNDDKLYKSYLIDDWYTYKFIDSIYYDTTEVLIESEYYNKLQGSNTRSEFLNTVSQSTFLNDSTLVTIGTLKYLVHYRDTPDNPHFKRNNVTVLLIINLRTDEFNVKPLRFNETNINPQPEYLKIINNEVYFELFPSNFLRKIPNSPKYVVGKINLDSNDWQPLVELPMEYVTSNIRLSIGYNYRISEYNNMAYFMSPLTNYLFNLEQDTIWLSDLVDPIQFSLNKFNSTTVSLPQELYKLDSISHSIVDFYFKDDFIYVILNTPIYKDGKIYVHKYNNEGKFINSKELNEGKKLETAFYSEKSKKIFKVYLENEEWYIEEVYFD